MIIVPLYRYHDSDGVVVVTPNKRHKEDEHALVRLIAAEGHMLTNDGKNFTPCIDTESADGWYELAENTESEV